MKQIIIFILLMNSTSVYSEWSDSVKEGWDKSKDYGVQAWESTKNIWNSSNEVLPESETTRKITRIAQKDEDFKKIWGSVFKQLGGGLEYIDKIKRAPASAFFRDDKDSLREELNIILDKTLVLLEDNSLNSSHKCITS
jgi:hypothetical protein